MSKQSVKIIVVIVIIIFTFRLSKNIFFNSDTVQIEKIIKEGAFLVDVRTPEEFADGHVKISINIPLDKIQNQLPKFKGKKNIIVFCRSGNRSGKAKSILEKNGFTNVIDAGTWQEIDQILKK